MKFYRCKKCGNIITSKDTPICCEDEMEELIPNTVDAALEKHVPVYKINNNKIEVTVGEVEHPMLDNHYITLIAQVSDDKINMVKLNPGDKPSATFEYIKDSKIYEYCNLHGLWVTDVK